MIKLIGSLLLICAGAGFGSMKSENIHYRLNTLRLICEMFESIRIMLENACLTTNEILDKLKKDKRFVTLGMFEKISPDDKYTELSEKLCIDELCVTDDDKALLTDYFSKLGSTDITSEISKAKLCRSEFQSRLGQEEEYCKKYSKLYRAMGVLGGTFAAIMLI